MDDRRRSSAPPTKRTRPSPTKLIRPGIPRRSSDGGFGDGGGGQVPAEVGSGSITRLELVDFMNHASLNLNLSPGVNAITGRNGAGKSSILQAIVIGLGKLSPDICKLPHRSVSNELHS